MPVRRLKEFLDAHHVKYVTISHSPAFTAKEIAASAHIPGKQLAKTVMVLIDGKMAMAVLPASSSIDFSLLREMGGAKEVRLASEPEFSAMFPECEPGAMPPFGNLYGLPVWVDESLTRDDEIAFNAGNHDQTVHLKYADFARLVEPKIAALRTSTPAA